MKTLQRSRDEPKVYVCVGGGLLILTGKWEKPKRTTGKWGNKLAKPTSREM